MLHPAAFPDSVLMSQVKLLIVPAQCLLLAPREVPDHCERTATVLSEASKKPITAGAPAKHMLRKENVQIPNPGWEADQYADGSLNCMLHQLVCMVHAALEFKSTLWAEARFLSVTECRRSLQ